MADEAKNSGIEPEFQEICTRLLELGRQVEGTIANSIRSLAKRDSGLAREILELDQVMKSLAQGIDVRCLELLAFPSCARPNLHRFSLAFKVLADLGRIIDYNGSIARHVLELNRQERLKPFIDLVPMTDAAVATVRDALTAFAEADRGLAAQVFRGTRLVDEFDDQMQRVLLTVMMEDPGTIGRAGQVVAIARCLKTISEHAGDIAERVLLATSEGACASAA